MTKKVDTLLTKIDEYLQIQESLANSLNIETYSNDPTDRRYPDLLLKEAREMIDKLEKQSLQQVFSLNDDLTS